MIETTRLTTYLPGFAGFLGTRWTDLFPSALETCVASFARYGKLSESDLRAILWQTSEAQRFFASLAERYCRRYDAETSRRLGFKLGLKFAELDVQTPTGSTTDRILATMSLDGARHLLARSAEDGHRRLIASIRDRFVAFDGVTPDPADAVEQRLAAPIERWSPTELCDLLAGFVPPGIDGRLYAKMTGGRDVDMAFEAAVIWAWFSVCADARRQALSANTAKI